MRDAREWLFVMLGVVVCDAREWLFVMLGVVVREQLYIARAALVCVEHSFDAAGTIDLFFCGQCQGCFCMHVHCDVCICFIFM